MPHLRMLLDKHQQLQTHSDCSRLLVFSWIAPALAGHGSQLGHVLVALNYAFLNRRTLVVRCPHPPPPFNRLQC